MAEMVPAKFLDQSIRNGVSAELRDTLLRVDGHLRERFSREKPAASWRDWHGVYGVLGYRDPPGGFHTEGKAIDINADVCGYGIVRSGNVYGGEARSPALVGVIERAAEALDGMMLATVGRTADIRVPTPDESVQATFWRFQDANLGMRSYLRPYFRSGRQWTAVSRQPVPEFMTAPREAFQPLATRGELIVPLETVPMEALRWYEASRIPLVIGSPSYAPQKTRNPANGFMDLQECVVTALCDVGGLRWGGAHFGTRASGDFMHFDTARRIYK